jgi:hypothetical protein
MIYSPGIDSLDFVSTVDWGVYNTIFDEMENYYVQNRSKELIAKNIYNKRTLVSG